MTDLAFPFDEPDSPRYVGIQFRRAAAIVHQYLAGDFALPHGTRVVVETEHGEALGWTVGEIGNTGVEDEAPAPRRVIRIANAADLATENDLKGREREALRYCALRARELGLDMKLVAVEWQHSGGRAVFYFSSEERVDFRALVRELAQKYRCRVEMRQVGPRDEAKIIGAMGPCGRETCCSSWMRGFAPVSIKMAKDQGLALNPQKTMGVCGRLLCCLAYEQDTYTALRKALPRVGKQVETPQGPGRVIDVLALRGAVRVALDAGGRWEEFPGADVRPIGRVNVGETKDTTAVGTDPAGDANAKVEARVPSHRLKDKKETAATGKPDVPSESTTRIEVETKPERHRQRPKRTEKSEPPRSTATPDARSNPVELSDRSKSEGRHQRRRRRGRTDGKPGGDGET